jgi:hypothetical protein
MPDRIRDALKETAETDERTLNPEMVARLRASLEPSPDLQNLVDTVERNSAVAAEAIKGIAALEARMSEHISTMGTLLTKFLAGEIVVKDKD